MRRGYLWFATTAVGAVGVALLVAPLVISTSAGETRYDWDSRLGKCVVLADGADSAAVLCGADVWRDAYLAEDLPSFYVALDTWTRRSPQFSMDCHGSGHKAGREVVDDVAEGIAAIEYAGTASGACNNGFLHGVLDRIGNLGGNPSEYRAVVAACMKSEGMIRDACSDGVGHSAWISGRGVAGAVETCLAFTQQPWRNYCTAGVVMQMLRVDPFTGAPPYFRRTGDIAATTAHVCAEFVEAGADADMELACWREGPGPLIDEAAEQAQQAWLSLQSAPEERDRQQRAAWSHAYSACEAFNEYRDDCRERVAYAVTWTVGDDPARKAAICPAFSRIAHQVACRQTTTR